MSETPVDDPETTELDLPDDGWDENDPAPPAPRRSRWLEPLPLALFGLLLAGAGFLGGVQVQKHSDDDGGGGLPGGGAAAAMAGRAGGPGGYGGAGPAGAGGGQGAAAGGRGGAAGGQGTTAGGAGSADAGVTVGEVANVRGSRLYVTTTDGTTVEVRVGSQAKVQRLSHSSAGGVHPGDSIVVQGTTRSDGSVSATAVQATAPGLTSIGAALAGRFGGGQAGASSGGASGGGSGSGSGGGRSSSSGSSGSEVDQLFDGG